jgi:hypothetical protein
VRDWSQRNREVANLRNPAFCSLLLRESIVAFQKEKKHGLPYPLSFLILPIVLHKSTRELLPNTTRTKLHVWLEKHPEVHIRFAQHVRRLTPHTRESLTFGLRENIIAFNEDGELILGNRRPKKPAWSKDTEPAICHSKARFLGRWFAQAGDTANIFTMWGIRP